MRSLRNIRFSLGYYPYTVYQLAVAFVSLWLTRYFFYIFNAESIGEVAGSEFWQIMGYGTLFDLSAAAYFNIPFILLRFMPFPFARKRGCIRASNIVYGIFNSLMLILNIADIAFVSFNGGRMRWETLCGIFADGSIWKILFSYAAVYWVLYLFLFAYIALTLFMAYLPRVKDHKEGKPSKKVLAARCVVFLAAAAVTVFSIRGVRLRPLNVSDALSFVDPSKSEMVLNSPFTVVRTIGKKLSLERLDYYTEAEIGSLRENRYHFQPGDSIPGVPSQKGKNLVVIVMESGGRQLIDRLAFAKGEPERKLFPFLDSIVDKSLIIENMMGTGLVSNNGLNAIFMGFPSFDPVYFVNTQYVSDKFDTPVQLLEEEGYSSKFYYGCHGQSYFIGKTVALSGFDDMVSLENFPRKFDDTSSWGLWDHDVARFVADDLRQLPQPFMAAWFTSNAHSPFEIPSEIQSGLAHKEGTPEAGLEYTDYALAEFFKIAETQPWYKNTVFLITADHGNRDFQGTSLDTPWIKYHLPFILFTPDGSIKPERISGPVMSQFDIMPTLLHIMGYDKPFLSLGSDAFDSGKPHYGLSKVGGQLMITGNRYAVFTDEKAGEILRVFDVRTDETLKHPLTRYDAKEVEEMHRWARAFMQDYTGRLIDNRMTLEDKRKDGN